LDSKSPVSHRGRPGISEKYDERKERAIFSCFPENRRDGEEDGGSKDEEEEEGEEGKKAGENRSAAERLEN